MKSLQASRAFLVFSFLSSIDILSTRFMCSQIGLAIIIPPIFIDFRISAAKLRFSFEKTMLFRQVFTRYDVKSCQVHDETWQLLY